MTFDTDRYIPLDTDARERIARMKAADRAAERHAGSTDTGREHPLVTECKKIAAEIRARRRA